jgi:protein-S-isoprenylcysteine O-methyltransferase Ste14
MKQIQLLVKSLAGTLFFLLILFISAGRINYWQGWLYASINIILVFLNSLALRNKAELAAERTGVKSGTKSWDKAILGLSALMLVMTYIVAGLDSGRNHWSPPFHWWINAAGAILILSGEVFFLLAQKENRYLSSLMRIQKDRGHTVCDTGIYKIVRHPMYAGNIITALGIPLILGSLWGFVPVLFSIILILIRTSLEDKTLINELDGYSEYASRTRYRLLPYLW